MATNKFHLDLLNVDKHGKSLEKATFPNDEKYHNISKGYSDFFQKSIEAVNNIAPIKTARIRE